MTDLSIALGGMVGSVTAIASIDPLQAGEKLGEASASSVFGVACIALCLSVAFLVKALILSYRNFVQTMRETVQTNTAAIQRVSDSVDANNKLAVETKDAVQRCRGLT